MDQMEEEMQLQAEACAKLAVEFTRRYYETFDKHRAQVTNLFVEGGTLTRGESVASTKDDIRRMLLELPASVHELDSLGAKPIATEEFGGHYTIAISIIGSVKYEGEATGRFVETFIIILVDGHWRIKSSVYSTQGLL